jgi:hypothetical protein
VPNQIMATAYVSAPVVRQISLHVTIESHEASSHFATRAGTNMTSRVMNNGVRWVQPRTNEFTVTERIAGPPPNRMMHAKSHRAAPMFDAPLVTTTIHKAWRRRHMADDQRPRRVTLPSVR